MNDVERFQAFAQAEEKVHKILEEKLPFIGNPSSFPPNEFANFKQWMSEAIKERLKVNEF